MITGMMELEDTAHMAVEPAVSSLSRETINPEHGAIGRQEVPATRISFREALIANNNNITPSSHATSYVRPANIDVKDRAVGIFDHVEGGNLFMSSEACHRRIEFHKFDLVGSTGVAKKMGSLQEF
ncbi:hypothetical protein HPP92_004881 [Vanilla planifolia]|uniref:Uncharacterized protein n=1 Tax=Vanilla planifolia TaxID=51239 RepID=A0A835VBL3_VANPL|nr:hypothetical protein HPP92_004881 [Vanilla planifolia]